MTIMMNIDRNKVIYPDFDINVLYKCRDGHDDMPMVDLDKKLPPRNL